MQHSALPILCIKPILEFKIERTIAQIDEKVLK